MWLVYTCYSLFHLLGRRYSHVWSGLQSLGVPAREMKRGTWTEEEHNNFLIGLAILGEGNWAALSRIYVPTRNNLQVRQTPLLSYASVTRWSNIACAATLCGVIVGRLASSPNVSIMCYATQQCQRCAMWAAFQRLQRLRVGVILRPVHLDVGRCFVALKRGSWPQVGDLSRELVMCVDRC